MSATGSRKPEPHRRPGAVPIADSDRLGARAACSIGAFFYVIVINKSNIDGFTLMKIVVKVLKNALKDEYEEEDEDEEEDDDEEFNEDDYELDEIIH